MCKGEAQVGDRPTTQCQPTGSSGVACPAGMSAVGWDDQASPLHLPVAGGHLGKVGAVSPTVQKG